ncbi:MAG: glycosyl transferase [Rubellimicrobium sp.]|nr:glycosyl transferase [Rubellimicrobium sp.]
MAEIAFILLCHKNPDAVIEQARQMTAAGDRIAIHFDGNAPAADYARIRAGLAGNASVTFAARRVRCGWGEWSLVAATILTVEAALAAFPGATHFYMVSGDCMAIKSAAHAHDYLDAQDADYIESVDFFDSGWIRTGLREERLVYRHWLNERRHKALFYLALNAQRKLGLRRAIPSDLQMQIGSQWWCLRRATVESVLAFTRRRRDVMRFFRTTWIPDETFFQTLVRHLVPEAEIRSRTLTFLMFTDYGMPATFYNDHYDLLLSQDYLFARKISPEAHDLKARLADLWASGRRDFRTSNEGRRLFEFLTGRGRIGRRFASRFWETDSALGRDRELLILASKKWHVAKRLAGVVNHYTGLPAIHYLFNEEDTPLPDLGGIQATLAKRTRHRRALVRMLFDYYDSDRLLICMDTANLDLMQDFDSDRSTTRVLEIDCLFSDDYLMGHARRIGLAGDGTPEPALRRIIPAIRNVIASDSDRLRDAGLRDLRRIGQARDAGENAAALAAFLAVGEDVARAIARTPGLFAD